MLNNAAYNKYRNNSVNTSTPEELTLMLYNGLIKFIMQGQAAIRENNIEKANSSILRAQDIVNHFMTTLDKKYKVAQELELLYDYIYRRLIEANTSKSLEILDEILGMSRELRDTWAEAMKIAKKQIRMQEKQAAAAVSLQGK